jgi:hypothetical protein
MPMMRRADALRLAALWPADGHARRGGGTQAGHVSRAFVVSGVLALLVSAGSGGAAAAGPPPSTTDTWTIAGCVIGLANSFVPAHRHVAAHWHTDGTVTCTGAELDGESRVDLTRNRVPVPESFTRETCDVTAVDPCTALRTSRDTAYHGPRADWRPRLVLFVRGPLSVPGWMTSDYCVLDIPTFKTICTFLGQATRQ